jgi:spermidine synthase
VKIGDAYELIESTPGAWDVIIADLTDPIEEGPAFKLFTQEFFAACKRALRAGGVFVNQAGSLSPPLCGLTLRVLKTISTVFAQTGVITANVPTYGSPWGLAMASDRQWERRPDPARIDSLLKDQVKAPLKMFDGQALLGMLQTPKYLRERLSAETMVYTLKNPPKFFGGASTAGGTQG